MRLRIALEIKSDPRIARENVLPGPAFPGGSAAPAKHIDVMSHQYCNETPAPEAPASETPKHGSTDLPLVSIIIPCYNAEKYVAEAIQSALDQTYQNCEIIVIDDCSTDGSLDVIKSFADRIQHRAEPKRGACAARNTGWRASSGSYIKFHDADDTLTKDIVRVQVEEARRVCSVSSRIIVFSDVADRESGRILCRNRDGRIPEEPGRQLEWLLRNNLQTSSPLHPRAALEQAGGFDETLPRAQEYDLHLRLSAHGYRFHFLPGVAAEIRASDSPTRISNVDSLARDPMGHCQRIRRRIDTLRKIRGCELPAGAIRHLSDALWSNGRECLRRGYSEEAREYFCFARDLAAPGYQSQRSIYRILVRFLGPFTCERTLSKFRRRE